MTDPAKAKTTHDRGSATIWVVAVALVFMTATAAVSVVAVAITKRHQVATAADLSALAAASTLASAELAGDADATQQACRVAADIAIANGARLGDCRSDGSMVDVRTILTLPAIGYPGRYSVSAQARAGPP